MMQALLNSEEGVSPVVGMLLILTIIILSITVICVGGLPLINAARESAHLQGMRNSFAVLHADIEEVVRGPIVGVGPARITRMNIGGGALSVTPVTGSFQISNESEYILHINPGIITYEYAEQTIAYENGATFSRYRSGAVMDGAPLIFIQKVDDTNITVMIHVINITGTDSSVGGKGFARVRTSYESSTSWVPAEIEPNAQMVTINITSKYYDAWGKYFERELERINTTLGGTLKYNVDIPPPNTTIITINGTDLDTTNDIYLCVYETQISAQVE